MKKILLILALALSFSANADLIEATDPTLDVTFTDEGLYHLDRNTGLNWLNFSDLVSGDLTLGYSVTENQDWFGPAGWRLPTYTEVYGLFETFFEPEFVDSGNGTMIFDTSADTALKQSRNSWLMDFGTTATETTGSTDPDDAILHSIGLYLDENDVVQMMGIEFDAFNLITTIYSKEYDRTDLNTNTAYADYGVFMIHDAVVPIPAAIWLFGSGLPFLLFVARRKLH